MRVRLSSGRSHIYCLALLMTMIMMIFTACKNDSEDVITDLSELPAGEATSKTEQREGDSKEEGQASNTEKEDHEEPVAEAEGIVFTTEGTSFSPIIEVIGSPKVTWVFSDGTSSDSLNPSVDFASEETRVQTLIVEPWSQLTSINLGYDARDGGNKKLTFNEVQNVSKVENLSLVAPYLEKWFASYNPIESLDFNGFIRLNTIEMYKAESLKTINLKNTPSLERLCVEECNLEGLDLSESPMLKDLRGALNAYEDIVWADTYENVWHICIRDNEGISNESMFADTSSFPSLAELFIWNTNQSGLLKVGSSHQRNYIKILAESNHYTEVDLSGALQQADRAGSVKMANNDLKRVNIDDCSQLTHLDLSNNQLPQAEVDQILISLDQLGRSRENISDWVKLTLNLSGGGNEAPSAAGIEAIHSLQEKGWEVHVSEMDALGLEAKKWKEVDGDNVLPGNSRRIYFATNGETTNVRCDFSGEGEIIWHFSDGRNVYGESREAITIKNLNPGFNYHYLEIQEGLKVTRFGAGEAGLGNLVEIAGLNYFSDLQVLYLYKEEMMQDIGSCDQSGIREYHLMNTNLSREAIDKILSDIVASGVENGKLWSKHRGNDSSKGNIMTLEERGWKLSFNE